MKHPERLGKYPIAGVLGEGAMGVVYKGFDPMIHRPVAIKTIQKTHLGESDESAAIAARFRNEAQAVGRLSHPGIVQIYEYGEDDDTAFIAMEYVEGRTLEKLLSGRGRLPEPEVLSLMDQLLDALDCAHRAGVWHRDIKPANLLVTYDGQLKVTDFGVARIASIALTRVASMIGTPGYMAPEQYTGEGLSHRVDLFAAGVLLYRLLTGQAPFVGPAQTVMYKILHEDPPPPSMLSDGASPLFYDAVVARALAKEPEDRYASAGEFRQALAVRGVPMVRSRATPAELADDDATVVVPASRSAGARPSTGASSASMAGAPMGASPGAAPGSSGGAADWTTGANAPAVADVERQLATVMGPIAKAIVKQAARTVGDVDSLRLAVAQHIPDERERAQFVSGAKPQTGTRTLFKTRTAAAPEAPSGTQAAPPVSGAGERLTEATTAAALPLMVEIVGPIAKVLVRKAATQATTKAQFVQALADAVEPADQPKVLAAMQKL